MIAIARDLGIDLGTANLVIFQKGRGIVVREPTVVAIVKATGAPKAFGREAQNMVGRTPAAIEIIQPIRDGAIANYTATEAMLRHYFNKLHGRATLTRPRVVISVPCDVTSVERQALLDACAAAGAKDAFPIEEPLAAALGLGLGVGDPTGNLTVDIGAGTTDVAVISLGGSVVSATTRLGGEAIDEAVHRHVKRRHNVLLGERSAEELKFAIGSAWELEQELEAEVSGRDMGDGMPKTVTVSSAELRADLAEPLGQISNRIRSVLERTPPELANDIAQNGLWLSGGGALLRGMNQFLAHETGLTVHVSEDPLLCVANGAGRALQQIEALTETHFTFVGEK